ncbi:uncharacterized protein LOC108910910 [Anoplophora glabripennis]|uniref:uncharacterized protein LOC108910910 n=1 Tax=Anoplophora glabripennis TaxID=217634 RepID=UPI000874D945|nr:uncharacterized protein LOC108910910 [Anoplophora glabripennis]
MDRAIRAVRNGSAIKRAAQQFHVPYPESLWDKLKQGPSNSRLGRKTILSSEEERAIAEYIKLLAKSFYGISSTELRRACFEYVEVNNIRHPFNTEKKIAGRDWYYGFLKRNSDITVRTPEPISLNRINAFNKTEVNLFFSNLEIVYEKFKFGPEKIDNVNETGITTVHVPGKILAGKGLRRCGAITRTNSDSNYIPPLFIYPRQRLPGHFSKDGPLGSIYKCSKSGWITEDIFLEWLEHFTKFIRCDSDNPVLLVMDKDISHTSYKVYKFCKAHVIVVVSLPPHTSHRLQPLDFTFFSPLKTAYNNECSTYLKTNTFAKILQEDIAMLFARSYNRVATIEKAVKGFQCTGIYPLNKNIFADEEFSILEDNLNQTEPSTPNETITEIPGNEQIDNVENPIVPSTSGTSKSTTKLRITESDSSTSDDLVEVSDEEDFTSDKTLILKTSFSDIYPLPAKKQ